MSTTPLISDSQWSASEIQVINWGGFHGHHRMSFALGATLLTGTSGSGKSTLLDAVIADLMPHTVAFNGASNDSVGGPPRGGQQRSVLTYLRGKLDTAADGADGRLTDKVLRGNGEPTWGAVALSFVNSDTRRFTVLRTYFVRAGATNKDGVTERRFTVPGIFDLSQIVGLQDGMFAPERMKARFDQMKHHASDAEFRQVFCTRLGIGTTDSGEKALRLLARIQAAHPLSTVDKVYKETVLEDPATLARADECLAHFATLDQSYRDLETAGKKELALRGITDEYSRWQEAVDKAARIDRFGVGRIMSATTPFKLWRLRHKRRLLDAAERVVRDRLVDAKAAHAAAKTKVAGLQQQLAEIEQQQRENGGDALQLLEAKLRVAQDAASQAEARLDTLLKDTEILNVPLGTKESLGEAVAAARTFAETYTQARAGMTGERDRLLGELPDVQRQIRGLVEELRSLSERDGLVPKPFHDARKLIAEACNLKLADLPFAAELVDVHPDYEQWRTAAEVTLGGIGLTLLMDERRQEHVRRSIDRLRLPRRVNFEGVNLAAGAATAGDQRFISGVLIFKDESPFAAWVKDRVTRTGTDHLCVNDPSELGGSIPKVTVNGQTSHDRRGAHGRNPDQRPILGFSNEARKEEIRAEARQLQVDADRISEGIKSLDAKLVRLDALDRAHQKVLGQEWERIDVPTPTRTVADLTRQRHQLLAESRILETLAIQHAKTKQDLGVAGTAEYKEHAGVEQLEADWSRIVDSQDATMTELAPIEDDGGVEMDEADDLFLQDKLAERDAEVTWDKFDSAAEKLAGRLYEESKRERDAAAVSRQRLEATFAAFSSQWPDPNRGITIDAYREYANIYDEIISDGLHSRQAKFQRQMQEWSGDDLRLLNNAYDESKREIEDRMEPVNRFLAAVPFGPQKERLQMTMKDVHNPEVDLFRTSLRALSSNTTQMTVDEAGGRFLVLREFMGRLGWSETGTGKRSDDLLDVRRHVRIGASRFDAGGREVGVYESLAGKSGGESQELAAFIIGAALRYQLGDGDRPQPRFAPVFLDEGFVKADWEYAGRAVQAWRSLGFQLIVSAPLDKVTALEPQMDAAAVITKDLGTGYSFIHEFPDMRTWAEAQGLKDAS